MTEPTERPDPLRPRQRPGVRVEAEAATWESVVFAISVGLSVRYLEVPAAQVEPFLANVDSGVLDEELAALATTPTGATLNVPGRIRTLAAFDRLVRGAVARAERDPLSGELTGPGWRPRKRRRDDRSRSDHDRGSDQTSRPNTPTQSPAVTPAGVGSAAGSAVGSVAKVGLWSSPAVAVGAVVAVVVAVIGVVAAAVVFAVARPGADPENQAASVGSVSVTPSVVDASAAATSAGATSAVGSSAVGTSAVGPSGGATAVARPGPPTSTVPSTATAGSAGTGSAAPAANPVAGSYSGVRKITANSGHPEAAIGMTESVKLTITAACAEPTCAVSVKNWGTATVQGSSLTFSGTATEPCKNSPGITVEDAWSVTLKPGPADASGAVQTLTGVGTVTVSALNGCDAKIYPLTWAYTATRTS